MLRLRRLLVPMSAILAAATLSAARGDAEDAPNLMKMNEATFDSASALEMIPRLRSILATSPDSGYTGVLRQMLLRSLVSSGASSKQIAAAADSTLPYMPKAARNRIPFYASVAQTLADRGEELPFALRYAERAVREAPQDDPQLPGIHAYALGSLGFVHFQSGKYDEALRAFESSLDQSPDSQRVLHFIGKAYEKKGELDRAISHYVRAVAVFPPADTTAAAELRSAYQKKHGSLKGLEERVRNARHSSADLVALTPRRFDRPSPPWELSDLEGKTVSSKSLEGKVVVLDFWGSWCGPCRIEMPIIEALYQKYRSRGDIVFMGVNWERTTDLAQHVKIARDYMAKNNLTFPSVIDPNQATAQRFMVQGFPTAYVIDKEGTIRYRNVGVAEGIEHILEAQIESLLQ